MGTHAEKSLTIIACGVLQEEVSEVARHRFPHACLHFIDPRLDVRPDLLSETLKRAMTTHTHDERKVLVFGKCAPIIDTLTSERGTTRVEGSSCYEILLGETFSRLLAEERGTYFLLPYTCLNFRECVIEPLGLDSPATRELIFKGYARIVLLDTGFFEGIEDDARAVSVFLDLPLSVITCGIKELEKRITEAVGRVSRD